MNIREIVGMAPVLPALTLSDLAHAVLDAIIGVGTLTRAVDFAAAAALPNVVSVGGSWVAPTEMINARDWQSISALARDTAKLKNN
jgi:2-dehydro-3-deoxyphosphogluconate aldolase / (4S)-4-hydroxy-2-oxoglutarate aldolase